MKKYELNRKQYERIRKMDHNDMKEYLNAVYENGYRAGERATSEKAAEVPDLVGLEEEMLRISESGISSPETVKQLRAAGFRGFLIGENFMKTPAPGEALKEFITQLEKC